MTYKQQFIKFLSDCNVLKFGSFKLKSGRVAPYFLNAGEYKTGAQLKKLGEFCLELKVLGSYGKHIKIESQDVL